MIKKLVSSMMVIVLFVLSSCTGTTPQHTYATELKGAIELLPEWQSDFVELGGQLTQELDPGTGITRLELIELYNIAMEYQIDRDEYSRLGLSALDALVAPSANISRDGSEIQEILLAATPVEEVKSDHQVLLDCIRTRIAFADELATSIRGLSAIDMGKAAELIACDPFESSLETLTAFVNDNK